MVAERQGVSAQQRGWAVAAAVVAGGVAVFGLLISTFLGAYFVLCAGVVAVPLLLRGQPKAFARTCLVVGVGLLGWGLIGALIGMFLFLPAALLLLAAAFVDPGNRPGARWAVVTPLAVAAAVWLAFVPNPHEDPDNEPPPFFSAKLDSANRLKGEEFHQTKERLRGFGATEVEVGEMAGEFKLHVGMPRSFAAGQSREALEEQIAQVPGVVEVRFCTFHTCGW
ncbi:hypothetical protein ACFWBN_13960 [Streptomyces sp. NPDC059989]|uniref:hypothetical protein n=1 Tax=Streptomyces sp. NPDC059989 TaxID=3347026 RepID=UPI0036887F9E